MPSWPSQLLRALLLAVLLHACISLAQTTNASVTVDDLLGSQNDGKLASSYTEGSLRGSLILYNGKIHTMDDKNTIVKVIAIKDGQIVYVGNSQDDAAREGRFDASSKVRTIDLGGRMAIPGLIDCHNHIVLLGNRPGYHTPLERAYSIADVQAVYKQRATGVPKGSFITTIGGFSPNQFKELRLPTLAELDAAAPDHPVFISTSFSGPATTNSLGKAILSSLPGNTSVTVSPTGAITSGLENGKALLALRANLTFADRQRSALAAMQYAASVGLTTHLDQGAFPATGTPSDGAANEDLLSFHNPFLSLYASHSAPIRLRINFLHADSDVSLPSLTARMQHTFPHFGNSMVRTGSIGEFVASDSVSGPVFEAALTALAKAKWRLEVHSLSSTDFQSQIQAFEKVNSIVDITGLRWVIAHVPRITAEYLSRLKALGGGVNLSGWSYLSGTGNATNPAGPPFRTIVQSGIRAGFGADGANIAPLSPWPHVYYAVTGKNAKGEVINPGQLATREEVLGWYTRDNRWFMGGEDEAQLGVLERGRLGDVVVLSADYFEVEEERLKELESVLTVVGGVVVHDRGVSKG
ncbi:N-substituted formamide deformylase [Podospora aff. communis PSN243]|uniref:N-substituted formamide deformylase n=1 Tax=Podospora aff. communis PSN243 TaxID=3040156 RepID=A0AAV9GQ85_9PEZI|nr:N-substituted formamide deformylase [Podospora aff. communis PSN243]